ncbi:MULTISPECIES: DUF4148 domain-containing protein [Comamonadaceae]|uniref:DUF4148 domain-containing protein n=1 Tax=Paracidovorax valerianellae TaxID=187868 RepID=A0A1G6S257_9BURK|nr:MULTISPECIES: DUF4148 domain-containing protein [Comamonadaceae]MDA8444166.1 DUF4148 domain-containing protein [Paracidovorax valerianellae]GKT22906.1 DUF4148 domain-containing protein [Acidovorax sp. SUPP3334]SDD10938.1 protein of unknown function [Paracidovorax valerianellae]
MNRKHLIAIAAIAFAGAASAAPVSQEDQFGAQPVEQGQPLTRAEVVADLNLWNRAGLNQFEAADRTPDADPAYQMRLAEYQRLRSGPEYMAEVQRVGGGHNVAGMASSTTMN